MKAPETIIIRLDMIFGETKLIKTNLNKGQKLHLSFSEKRQKLTPYVIVDFTPFWIKLKKVHLKQEREDKNDRR